MKTDPTPKQVAALRRWDRQITPWLVISALLPLVGAAAGKTDGPIPAIIAILCWLVFLIDLIVHVRLVPRYLHTTAGRVDLVIVIITCPWYLFVSATVGVLVTIARLARLGRVFWVAMRGGHARRLLERIGKAGLYAGGLLVACALIVKWVEPESSGYATYGDAFWWGFVTLTTVGYGDLYPVSTVGRIAAICLMMGGIALLGVLAGTLASFFGVDAGESTDGEVTACLDAAPAETPEGEATVPSDDDLKAEIAELRADMKQLLARLDARPE